MASADIMMVDPKPMTKDVDMAEVPTSGKATASQADLYSRMKALQKHLQFLDIQEEYIKD